MNTDEFDLAKGEQLKAEGIAEVTSHTERISNYKAEFEAAALSFNIPFTSEDITHMVGPPPSHPSAVGAMMNGMGKRGLIKKTGRMVKARRPVRHAGLLAEWE